MLWLILGRSTQNYNNYVYPKKNTVRAVRVQRVSIIWGWWFEKPTEGGGNLLFSTMLVPETSYGLQIVYASSMYHFWQATTILGRFFNFNPSIHPQNVWEVDEIDVLDQPNSAGFRPLLRRFVAGWRGWSWRIDPGLLWLARNGIYLKHIQS